MSTYQTDVKGLHHNAYRVRDSEETRKFYEDFLGLRLASALHVGETKTGRSVTFLHTFFEMADGSFLAFFEVPEGQDERMFQPKSDFDLHIALEVPDYDTLLAYKSKAEALGMPVRGVSNHGFMHSIYFADPSGYVVELTVKDATYDEVMQKDLHQAHNTLRNWQKLKAEGKLVARQPAAASA